MRIDTHIADAGFSERALTALHNYILLGKKVRFVTLGDIARYCNESDQGTGRLLNAKEFHADVVREIRLKLQEANLI